jgi:signal peptidase I
MSSASPYDLAPGTLPPWAQSARRRPSLRLIVRALLRAAFGFAIVIALATTVPALFGKQALTALSGSMEPAIGTGDVIVVAKISPLDARVGDVVSFKSADGDGKVITHRVVSMQATGDVVRFVTRGDANTGSERWQIAKTGTIGRVAYRVPKLGYVTNPVGSRFGRFAFIVIPAALLALVELRRIWRPASKDGRREVAR